jgi:hypothetical protein
VQLPVKCNCSSDCSFVYDPNSGFDSLSQQLLTILAGLGVDGLPTDYTLADLENGLTGDGIPDYYQLGLLGAVLCQGDAGITDQFNANKATFMGLINTLQGLFTQVGTLAAELNTTGDHCIATGVPELIALGGTTSPQAGLKGAAAEFTDFATTYGPTVGALGGFQNWFAGMGGLNTEMATTLNGLLGSLLSGIGDVVTELTQLALTCHTTAASIAVTLPTLAAELEQSGDDVDALVVALQGVTLPTFVIYGSSKTAAEAFSAAGDYNNDGVSNLTVYNGVSPAGTVAQRPAFVTAVSGANNFWQGNPNLPVLGGLGLMLLAGGCALGGALRLRRK